MVFLLNIWVHYIDRIRIYVSRTVEVDRRIGYFQREFKMKGYEVRLMLKNFPLIVNQDEKYTRVGKQSALLSKLRFH